MAHELDGALQQAGRIRQRCAMKEPNVYVRSEYIDVAEGRISQTCNWDSHHAKAPGLRPRIFEQVVSEFLWIDAYWGSHIRQGRSDEGRKSSYRPSLVAALAARHRRL